MHQEYYSSTWHNNTHIVDVHMLYMCPQNEVKERRQRERSSQLAMTNPCKVAALRKKFLDTAMTYIGVPYARRYHEPECTILQS